MAGGGVDGLALGALAAGGLFLYAAVRGKTITGSVQALIKGQPPSASASANAITGTSSSDLAALGVTSAGNAVPGGAGSTGSGSGGGSPGGSGGSGGSGGGPAPAGAAQAYAKSRLAGFGWDDAANWSALVALWNQESGWNANAVNPSSGAYGIPQALPAVWGHPYALGDYQAQVDWGLNYIKGRYGSPVMAEAHEKANGWY